MFSPANLGKSYPQCTSVPWYFWRYQDLALLSCSLANRGFLPFGIWMCHSWLSWDATLTPVQRMKWCVFAFHEPGTQWLIFHSSCLQSKAVCVSARPSCLGVPDKWQLQHRRNVVFGHRQSCSNDTSPKDVVLEFTQGKKKRTPGCFSLRCAIFLSAHPAWDCERPQPWTGGEFNICVQMK